MNFATGAVLAVILLILAGVTVCQVRNMRKGSHSCSCGCGSCPMKCGKTEK